MWIARDGEQNGKNDGEIWIHFLKPVLNSRNEWYCSDTKQISKFCHPEVLNGTCFELVLGEEVKDG